MVKVIIFDADGMIINGEMFTKHLSKDFNINPDGLSYFFANEFQQCLVGKADLKQKIKPYLTTWGWKKSTDEFLDYWFQVENVVNLQILDYVSKLRQKNIHCILATNQEKYRTNYITHEMNLGKEFDLIISSSQVRHKKPQIQFFQALLNKFTNVSKDEVLFWDDTLENVKSAESFGFKTELYKDFNDFKNKMQNYLPAK